MLIALCVINFVLSFFLWTYISDRRTWNRGICKTNGVPWIRFGTSSQGFRGYFAGDQYCWISWPVDKEPRHDP